MTRTNRGAPQSSGTAGGGGTVEVSGPHLVEIGNYAEHSCAWIVWMSGAASVEWALTWDDMDLNPDYVLFDPAFAASDSVQIILTNNTVTNVVAYATVGGTVYASEPVACAF